MMRLMIRCIDVGRGVASRLESAHDGLRGCGIEGCHLGWMESL